ncbi:hypothetical protein R1flu_010931 [Riccia fluitans]|uniref:Uncharacterized protein n=1 Tax=Riccia fluitans TaxID=41844 RepID=A0ABD1Z7F9_9MARC
MFMYTIVEQPLYMTGWSGPVQFPRQDQLGEETFGRHGRGGGIVTEPLNGEVECFCRLLSLSLLTVAATVCSGYEEEGTSPGLRSRLNPSELSQTESERIGSTLLCLQFLNFVLKKEVTGAPFDEIFSTLNACLDAGMVFSRV